MRGCCLHRGADEYRVKKRSFAFSLAYIKCFRTYSVYLSLRLPAQILYAGIHLCPLAVLRSCFGYSLSHLRTAAACRLAVSATGGARKPNPSEGGEGAPAPRAEINCFGKEDSNERNPSGVRFCSSRLCLAKARRGRSRAVRRKKAPCSFEHGAFLFEHGVLIILSFSSALQQWLW